MNLLPSLLLLCAVTSSWANAPQHLTQRSQPPQLYQFRGQQKPHSPAYEQRQHSVLRPRIFDEVSSAGIFGIGIYLGELVAGTLLALLVLYLAGVVYGLFTGKKNLAFSLKGRSVEDIQYAFNVAQQVYQAIESFKLNYMEESL